MHAIHPDLVAGRDVPSRDERENPLGTLRVIAATTHTVTLGLGDAQAELPADALLGYNQRDGLTLTLSRLGPTMLAALAARQG